MRAIREGVAESPTERVESFLRTSCTNGGIWRDLRPCGPCGTGADAEVEGPVQHRSRAAFDFFDTSKRRRFATDVLYESLESGRLTPRLDEHAFSIIAYAATHSERVCDAPDHGPEPDALNDSAYANLLPTAAKRRNHSWS